MIIPKEILINALGNLTTPEKKTNFILDHLVREARDEVRLRPPNQRDTSQKINLNKTCFTVHFVRKD